MGAACCGCAGGSPYVGPEKDQWLAPYLGTWAVKGGRYTVHDQAEISADRIIFCKAGDNSITSSGYTVAKANGVGVRDVGVVRGHRFKKMLSFRETAGGDVYWDSFGSHCSRPIDAAANPDAFTLRLQYGIGEKKYTLEFERVPS